MLASPFSTPPNALVMSAGKYIYGLCKGGVAFTNRDGNRYGIYITFIIPILNIRTRILVLYLQFVNSTENLWIYRFKPIRLKTKRS